MSCRTIFSHYLFILTRVLVWWKKMFIFIPPSALFPFPHGDTNALTNKDYWSPQWRPDLRQQVVSTLWENILASKEYISIVPLSLWHLEIYLYITFKLKRFPEKFWSIWATFIVWGFFVLCGLVFYREFNMGNQKWGSLVVSNFRGFF